MQGKTHLKCSPATISAVAASTSGSCSTAKPLHSSRRVYTVLRGRTHLNSSRFCTWSSEESMSRYTSLPYSDRILSGFMILKRRPASKQSWKNSALSWKLRSYRSTDALSKSRIPMPLKASIYVWMVSMLLFITRQQFKLS